MLRNRGNGAFWPAMNYPSGIQPTAVVAADFNSDGKVDLITANAGPSDADGSLVMLPGDYLDDFDRQVLAGLLPPGAK